MSGTVTKHVFLDFHEYQRLLKAKERNEELLTRIKELEQRLEEESRKGKPQDGHGNLSGIIARKEQKDALEKPLPEILESISMPPSAQILDKVEDKTEKKWYFLGPPPPPPHRNKQ